MRRLLLPAALLLAAAAILLLRAPSRPHPDRAAPLAQPPSAAPPVAAAGEGAALERVESRVLPMRLADRLTGEPLDLPIRLEASEDAPALRPGDRVDLSKWPPEARVRYPLLDLPGEAECDLGSALRQEESGWLLLLPYRCRLEIALSGAPIPADGVSGRLALIEDPRAVVESPEAQPGPFPPPGPGASLEGLMHWQLKRQKIATLHERALDGRREFPLLLAGTGSFLLSVQLADGSSDVTPVVLEPGGIVRASLELRPRPRLRGRLLDWNGEPVAGGKISMTVALNLDDYDLRPGDAHGLMAVQDGPVTHQSARRSYRTDADGGFELIVPRGRAYAVSSHERGAYAFWSTLDSGVAPSDDMRIELRLEEPGPGNVTTIALQKPDGLPLAAAEVHVGIANDMPFFRQWHGLETDEDGRLELMGVEAGARLVLSIAHPELNDAGYAPPFPVVPADRKLLIQLPVEALRAAL